MKNCFVLHKGPKVPHCDFSWRQNKIEFWILNYHCSLLDDIIDHFVIETSVMFLTLIHVYGRKFNYNKKEYIKRKKLKVTKSD